jgi:hypothetical protein
VQKLITIDSVGSAPHMVKYTVNRGVYLLFILPEPYSPNWNSHLDHNASIDADFLNEVPFGSVEICKEKFRGHICPLPENENIS